MAMIFQLQTQFTLDWLIAVWDTRIQKSKTNIIWAKQKKDLNLKFWLILTLNHQLSKIFAFLPAAGVCSFRLINKLIIDDTAKLSITAEHEFNQTSASWKFFYWNSGWSHTV